MLLMSTDWQTLRIKVLYPDGRRAPFTEVRIETETKDANGNTINQKLAKIEDSSDEDTFFLKFKLLKPDAELWLVLVEESEERRQRVVEGKRKYFFGKSAEAPRANNVNVYLNQSEQRAMPVQCILFLAANPSDQTNLKLDKELREIRDELQRSGLRDTFNLQGRGAVRPRDFVRYLLELKPTFLHFSGHGSKAGAIIVEGAGGATHEISPAALRALFAESRGVHCVVLNACYSQVQADAIAEHVPYVIGMNTAISDSAAIAFAVGFYGALGAGKDVQGAFALGVVELRLQNIPEENTPVLVQGKMKEAPSV